MIIINKNKTVRRLLFGWLLVVLSGGLGVTLPAQAFYIEVPKVLKDAWQAFATQPSVAQEGGSQVSPPPSASTPGGETFSPAPSLPPAGGEQPPATPQSGGNRSVPLSPLKDINSGAHELDRNLNKLDTLFDQAERRGIPVPPGSREKLERARSTVRPLKGADEPGDLDGTNLESLERDTSELENSRRQVMEDQRRLEGMKRGVRGMEQAVKAFERQLTRLTKQGLAAPASTTEILAKLKAVIESVKSATEAEMVESAFEEMQGLMDELNNSRQELEMLSRWPQTIRQVDRQVANLKRDLRRAKGIVGRLAKKEIDLSATYSQYEAAAQKLVAARDEAAAKAKAGDAEGAFSVLENDFFAEFEEVAQYQRVIDMMSNLGRFASEFKRGIAQSESLLKRFERRKLDTSELRALLGQAKSRGEEILIMLKSRDLDEDAVLAALQEMEDLRQQFMDQAGELGGEEAARPWDKGGQNFQEIKLAPGVSTLFGGERRGSEPPPTRAPDGPAPRSEP